MTRPHLLLTLLLTTTACSGRPRPAPVADTTAASAVANTTAVGAVADTTVAGVAAAPERPWTADSVVGVHPGGPAVLQEVATPAAPARLVFRFDTRVPSYRVLYQDSVYHCGSGEPLVLPGSARLVVAFRNAAAHDDAGHATVAERDRADPVAGVLRLATFCDFEGDVSWVAALPARARFRVTELEAPPRLVVELAP